VNLTKWCASNPGGMLYQTPTCVSEPSLACINREYFASCAASSSDAVYLFFGTFAAGPPSSFAYNFTLSLMI